MRILSLTSRIMVGALLAVPFVTTQQPSQPASGCSTPPAQIDANKRLAIAAFRGGVTPADRLALMDQSYVQHDPTYKKYADQNKISYYEGFKRLSAAQADAGRRGGGPTGAQVGPQPPRANPIEIV